MDKVEFADFVSIHAQDSLLDRINPAIRRVSVVFLDPLRPTMPKMLPAVGRTAHGRFIKTNRPATPKTAILGLVLTLFWIGLLIGIPFLATPAKFPAPRTGVSS